MKRFYFPLLLSVILLSLLTSCNEHSERAPEKHAAANNTALLHVKALDDSCSKAWKMMIDSDDQKVKDIQRLLQEISYIPGHNEKEVQRLSALAKDLQTKRYTQSTMTSDRIDAYDRATDYLVQQVFDLKRNTKGIENYTLAGELETSILEADGMVVNYRVLYDRWAQQYNASLEQLGAHVTDEKLVKKLTFQL